MDLYYEFSSTTSSSSFSNELYSSLLHVPATQTHKRKAGRKKFKETRHPIYRGVRQRNRAKWVCEVREPNKKSRIWLGTYSTPEMAARAYDVAALALRGKTALLNFPDSAWLLPRPISASARDIRTTAFEAAQAFGPTTSSSPMSPSSSASSTTTTYVKLPPVKNVVEKLTECTRTFWDEEAMFNMPRLLDSMAEGLLLAPPSVHQIFDWDDVDNWSMDLSLWSD